MRNQAPEVYNLTANLDDRGDTLLEVLMAITVLALSAVILFGSFSTSITAAGTHENKSNMRSLLSSFVEVVTSQVEFGVIPKYKSCDLKNDFTLNYYQNNIDFSVFEHKLSALNDSSLVKYQVGLEGIEYWNGSQFSQSCTLASRDKLQLLFAKVSSSLGKSMFLRFTVQNLKYSRDLPNPPEISYSPSKDNIYPYGKFTQIPIDFKGYPSPLLTCWREDLNRGCQYLKDGKISLNQGSDCASSLACLTIQPSTPIGKYVFLIRATNGYPIKDQYVSVRIPITVAVL